MEDRDIWLECQRVQEEYEKLLAKTEKKPQANLNTRQWVLKMWLESNFQSGRYFSIEEVVEGVRLYGEPLYELNKNPRIHDKCLLLSQDVNAINECVVNGYKIIVKNEQGGIKLCESQREFDEWYFRVTAPLFKTLKRMNLLKWKTKWDGTMPLLNKAGNPVPEKKQEFIDVFCQFDD